MQRIQIMGILNLTPDSFYDKSRVSGAEAALERAYQMQLDGADWIDVGGESSRPNAESISEAEERARVMPTIEQLSQRLSIPFSIDTIKPKIAAEAIALGASLINDVSGFSQPEMIAVAANCQAKLCLMHSQGGPKTMQQSPHYPNGVVTEILHWFDQRLHCLEKAGVDSQRVILDPGIGFGKTVAHNLEILHNLHRFKIFGLPLLLGCSRKWFLRQIANKEHPEDVLPETLAVHTLACLAGVDILRVHDIKEHRAIAHLMAVYRDGFSSALLGN